MDKKKLTINLITSVIAFILNIGINFFLTPYIVGSIGVEAYGFVALGANFIGYVSLVTIALNSMAGRFITIEIHKENWEAANTYFSSVFIANIIAIGVISIPSILFIFFVDQIINVPEQLLRDVKILFVLLFMGFIVSILLSTFGVATFVKNKLYLQSLRKMEATFIQAIILLILFICFEPVVSFVGFAGLIAGLYMLYFSVYYTNKLLPEIKIRKAHFNYIAVKELISSGIWNTITRLGLLLLDGLDLLIANMFISVAAMGTLAIAKTFPSLTISLVGIIAGVFMPDFTRLFALNKSEDLLKAIKNSMKLLGIVISLPLAILVSFGYDFFSLWVPTQDARLLQILSILTIATIIVSGPINSIYGIFTVTNKLKANSMILIFTGLLNVAIVFILLKTTSLGLYAVAGVSSVLGILRNLFFTAPFGAKYLDLKWYTFFPEIAKAVIAFLIASSIGLSINYFFDVNDWFGLFLFAGITAILGLLVNTFVILDKQEREHAIYLIKNKVSLKKGG